MNINEKKYFEAGEKLRAVGASFVISFLYWRMIDSTHTNWQLAKTNNPKSILNNKEFWYTWIEAIVDKDPGYLGKNKINLSGNQIIDMAKKLLFHLKQAQ